jgi:hypothetical protein
MFRDALRGKVKLATSLLVIAEIIWSLEFFYKLEKSDIAAKVEKILNTPQSVLPGNLVALHGAGPLCPREYRFCGCVQRLPYERARTY